jgi:hypothetical protein
MRGNRARRGRKGRGAIGRRVRALDRQRHHVDIRNMRSPTSMPTIQQSTVAERWVRITITRPTPPAVFRFTTKTAYLATFGTTATQNSYLFIKKIRVWLEGSGDITTLVLKLFARPDYLTALVDTTGFAATILRDDGVAGSSNACINVDMPELWKITAFGPSTDNWVFQVITATDGASSTAVDQLTIDVLAHVHQNRNDATFQDDIPISELRTNSEEQHFEMLSPPMGSLSC